MKIREANDSDIFSLLRLEKMIFGEASWNENDFYEQLHLNPYAKIYVLMQENIIVGYVDLWIAYENSEIANIAVNPQYREQGYGSYLMDFCMNKVMRAKCSNISLECRVSNTSAIRLYKKFGFENVGIRKNYYANGENAYLMVKKLEVIL